MQSNLRVLCGDLGTIYEVRGFILKPKKMS